MARNMKALCFFCDGKVAIGEPFCPNCDRPSDWATHEQRIEWEVRQWRSARHAPASTVHAPPPVRRRRRASQAAHGEEPETRILVPAAPHLVEVEQPFRRPRPPAIDRTPSPAMLAALQMRAERDAAPRVDLAPADAESVRDVVTPASGGTGRAPAPVAASTSKAGTPKRAATKAGTAPPSTSKAPRKPTRKAPELIGQDSSTQKTRRAPKTSTPNGSGPADALLRESVDLLRVLADQVDTLSTRIEQLEARLNAPARLRLFRRR